MQEGVWETPRSCRQLPTCYVWPAGLPPLLLLTVALGKVLGMSQDRLSGMSIAGAPAGP